MSISVQLSKVPIDARLHVLCLRSSFMGRKEQNPPELHKILQSFGIVEQKKEQGIPVQDQNTEQNITAFCRTITHKLRFDPSTYPHQP